MPILMFPSADALRLAIGSGVVPPAVANAEARGAAADGAVWLEPTAPLPRELIGPLGKLGVTARSEGPPLAPLLRWAELVPCHPDPRPGGRALVELPACATAAVWDRSRRLGAPLAFAGFAGGIGRLIGESAGEWLAGACAEAGGRLFLERAAGVWVEGGSGHALLDQLALAGPVVVPRAGRWQRGPGALATLDVALAPVGRAPAPRPPRFTARFRLLVAPPREGASVWVADDPGQEALGEWLAATGEAALAPLRVARLADGARPRVVFAGPRGRAFESPLAGAVGYCPHPRLANLLVPRGYRLSPPARADALGRAFGLGPREFGLLTLSEGRVACARVPLAAFRPVSAIAGYVARPPTAYADAPGDWSRLALPRFVAAADSAAALPAVVAPPPAARPGPPRRRAWLGRLLPTRSPRPERPTPAIPPPPGRVLEKLGPAAVTPGNEWATRRAALERRVLAELPRLTGPRRAKLWGELGEVYAATHCPADAAVCLVNAAWGDPGAGAAAAWLAAERRLARLGPPGAGDAAGALAAPKPAAARLACATLAHAAALPAPPPETLARLADLARLVDPQLPDLPARAAWLGVCALAKLGGGDALTLARGRDRLFERLASSGPSLDVDAPSFLRFRGVPGERHEAARDWLTRVREPMHRWLGRLATPGRLQWAGLDGDAAGTTAYADLMLAWGLAKLGDRARAAELDASAAAALAAEVPPGADPRVPRLLLDAFRHRARSAADGRPDPPGLPPALRERLAALDELGRYSVEKLRAASTILEPGELVDPYGGRGVAAFLGTDALGSRLARFLAARELLPRGQDARELHALALADPTATSLPRVAFALLEVSPRLDARLVAALLPLTVRAVELIPEWVRRNSPLTDPASVASRVGKRMVESACHAAAAFHLGEPFAAMTEELVRHAAPPDGPGARLAESVAGLYFRTLRRLGLNPLAALLLTRLRAGTPVAARELGLAVGHLAAGDDEAGNRILDAARERLLVRGISDDAERTAVALAYARALGDAVPRVALGRLEELFQRLEMVSTAGTANRYYTLHPLRLVDAAVCSAVGDEFAVGPGVRAWLADEEFATRGRVAADLVLALGERLAAE